MVIFAETNITDMRKYIALSLLWLIPLLSAAQEKRPFDVTISNDKHKIYIKMNLYDKDIIVPRQDVLGPVDGYIGSSQSRNTWIIVASRITGSSTAEIDVINDYGSEDFTAVIKLNHDGTYSYRKKGGSTLKFGVRGKWQKLPGSFVLKK